jgi:histone H3/H4
MVKHSKILSDNIKCITNPSIRRLGYVAGVKQMSSMIYEEIRGILKIHLENILKISIIYCEHKRCKTITEAMVSASITNTGYSSNLKKKRCKQSPSKREVADVKYKKGKKAIMEIKWYQKHSDCLNIPYESFSRLIREISQYFKKDLRFSVNAILLLQYSTENYLIDLLSNAQLCALHANRIGILPKDLQLVRKIHSNVN